MYFYHVIFFGRGKAFSWNIMIRVVWDVKLFVDRFNRFKKLETEWVKELGIEYIQLEVQHTIAQSAKVSARHPLNAAMNLLYIYIFVPENKRNNALYSLSRISLIYRHLYNIYL